MKDSVSKMLPPDVVVEESVIEPEAEGGVFNEKLYVLTVFIKKKSDIRAFLNTLFSQMSVEGIQCLKSEVDLRTDEDCNFYVRLSKTALLDGGIKLCTEDSVHIKIKAAVYPSKKESAVEAISRMLEETLEKR